MLIDSQFIPFILITIILTVMPGVDTMIVIKNVIAKNTKAGILSAIGICSGLLIHATLSALGVSVILSQSEYLFNMIKIIGALYLIWIGINTFREINKKNFININKQTNTYLLNSPFQEGILSNLFNPKVAIFFLAFFPQFISPDDPVLLKSLFLASIQFAIGLLWLSILSIFIFKVKNHILKPIVHKVFKSVTGTIFILLGIKLVLEESK